MKKLMAGLKQLGGVIKAHPILMLLVAVVFSLVAAPFIAAGYALGRKKLPDSVQKVIPSTQAIQDEADKIANS